MTLRVGENWFEFQKIDNDVTKIWEPHVDLLLRCNIWHIRGRDYDVLVDSGLGIVSLKEAAETLFDKRLMAVATHSHFDHSAGMYEFEERLVHKLEAEGLRTPTEQASLITSVEGAEFVDYLRAAGYEIPELILTALPYEGYDMASYRVIPAPATREVEEGEILDLGNRRFEILHLPGHSPGSIGLWEAVSGTLFSGDAIYDGTLLDELSCSDIPLFVKTMKRLRELPVSVVHAGHEPSFGRERLRELVDHYLELRA